MTKVAICPTITAYDPHEYRAQMEQIVGFAKRVHIDLMGGQFAPTKSPPLQQIWWPEQLIADIHLMCQHPMDYLDQLIKLKPQLVVIHYESQVNHLEFAARLHQAGIKAGLAILHETAAEATFQVISGFDHLLVFSGKLGHHGGEADLSLLAKVHKIHEHQPAMEIGWDGGINDQNAQQLIDADVTVLNVGGFIQKAPNPQACYERLVALQAD